MTDLQKLWKMFFISSRKLFSFWRYSYFLFSHSPLFLSVSHCLRAWSKINLKVYDVINCLKKNSIFVWYLEKEKRYHIETLAIDTGTFLWKNHAGNVHQTLLPDSFFILVNNSKQPLHAWNSFKNKIFKIFI